jgi:hypothetical protein
MLGGTLKSIIVGGVARFSADADDIIIGDSDTTFHADSDNNIAIGVDALANTFADSDDNIFIGKSAGGGTWVTASSNENVGIGNSVMDAAMNAANSNTAVGHSALSALTTGTTNVAVGKNAGAKLDSGDGNVLIGNNCGDAFDAENYNVAIGDSALGNSSAAVNSAVIIGKSAVTGVITTGADYTVAIGASALAALTSGSGNMAIGYQAMLTHTTGIRNIAIGYGSMNDTDAGSTSLASANNVFIGYDSGGGTWTNLASTHNVGVGNEALAGAMAGAIKNVAIGHGAGKVLAGGSRNVLVGYYSGLAIAGGGFNTFVGYYSGGSFTSDSQLNVGVGYSALGTAVLTTAADGAVAIGSYALDNLTSGAGNMAVGYYALNSLVDGDNNTSAGSSSGKFISTGSGNTYLGTNAGLGDTDARLTGNDNTSIGKDSGYSLQGAAHSNTVIGKNAGQGITTGSSNTIVGFGADVDVATHIGITRLGYYGAIKYITNRITCTSAHTGVDSVIVEVCKIPMLSIIKSVSVVVQTLANLTKYDLNLQLSTATGTAADGALVTSGITVPEILGHGTPDTYARSSGIAMGAASIDIDAKVASSGGTLNKVHYNEPTTTIVHTTSDCYLYVCNADNNGITSASTSAVLEIVVEYIGID